MLTKQLKSHLSTIKREITIKLNQTAKKRLQEIFKTKSMSLEGDRGAGDDPGLGPWKPRGGQEPRSSVGR